MLLLERVADLLRDATTVTFVKYPLVLLQMYTRGE